MIYQWQYLQSCYSLPKSNIFKCLSQVVKQFLSNSDDYSTCQAALLHFRRLASKEKEPNRI